MFICLDCHCVFEEPLEWQETHGLDSPPYETFSGCPKCYGSYVVAHRCDGCDEWIEGDYIKLEDGQRYCEDCFVHMRLGEEE